MKTLEELFKSKNITELFSEEVMEELTQEIIDDEYSDLSSRQDWEIEEFFEEVEDFENWEEYRKELLFETKSKEWGYKTLTFTIEEWLQHFVDYIDWNEKAGEEYERIINLLS